MIEKVDAVGYPYLKRVMGLLERELLGEGKELKELYADNTLTKISKKEWKANKVSKKEWKKKKDDFESY